MSMNDHRGIAMPAMGSSAVIPAMSDMSDWKRRGFSGTGGSAWPA
jgi:hypothetical protein